MNWYFRKPILFATLLFVCNSNQLCWSKVNLLIKTSTCIMRKLLLVNFFLSRLCISLLGEITCYLRRSSTLSTKIALNYHHIRTIIIASHDQSCPKNLIRILFWGNLLSFWSCIFHFLNLIYLNSSFVFINFQVQ